MKIRFKFKDDKSNPTAGAKAFLGHWLQENGVAENAVDVLSPEKIIGKGADYFVPNAGLLVEATQLIDNQDLAKHARWSISVNTLSKLIKDTERFTDIQGLYAISTPEGFGLKASQLKSKSILDSKIKPAAEKIIQAIIDKKPDVTIFGTKLKIEKVGTKDDGVYFSSIGKVKWINVAGIFHDNLKAKFKKANKQLDFNNIEKAPVKKKALLITNKYRLLTFDWDLFEGLSYSYEELVNEYKNIDEIWFQVEDGKGKFHHKLMYKRSLFLQFRDMNFTDMEDEDYKVFAKWFSALEKLDEEKKGSLIDALKILLANKSPHEIFPDSGTRIEMVRYGRWLVENGKRSEASWLVQQFMNDPDPLDPPTDDKENYGNELHVKIKEADKPDMHAIHTVRGHLAWTVQLLALKKDKHLLESYDRTQQILRSTQHLYLVLQWLFPLIEIANRRFWLQELSSESYDDFKNLCFELLDKYKKFPDIAKTLVRIFHYYRDLTTDEVKKVFDDLFNADDFDALLVYFAIYRENHFKEDKYPEDVRNYDSDYAKERLEEVVLSEDPVLLNLRSGIAWNIWKILSEGEGEFDKLSVWIDKFFTTKYDNHLFHNFERIIEDHIDNKTGKCLEWFVMLVKAAAQNAQERPDPGREIWLSTQTGDILQKLAKGKPDQLIGVVENLYQLWLKNAYIGGIAEVFSSYQYIDGEPLRNEAKVRFQEFYQQMKKINPKLQDVEWK